MKLLNIYSATAIGLTIGVIGASAASLVDAHSITSSPQKIAQANTKTNPRTGYAVINIKEFIAQKNLTVTTPNQVATKIFSYTGEEEGRKSEDISIKYSNNNAVILHTEDGLADDSLAARRYRVEMTKVNNKWQISWVGLQTKCWQGRGHQNWSGKNCR
jgi:hypothetical protein